MFVRQIDLNEALRLAANGVEVKALIPNPNGWEEYAPSTLQGMLEDVMFFRTEPAEENSEFEQAVQGVVAQDPANTDGEAAGDSGGTARASGKRAGAGAKRKSVDTGKIMALHEAGWTNKAIAEEMRMNEKTVWYYIDKARKEGQDAKG